MKLGLIIALLMLSSRGFSDNRLLLVCFSKDADNKKLTYTFGLETKEDEPKTLETLFVSQLTEDEKTGVLRDKILETLPLSNASVQVDKDGRDRKITYVSADFGRSGKIKIDLRNQTSTENTYANLRSFSYSNGIKMECNTTMISGPKPAMSGGGGHK